MSNISKTGGNSAHVKENCPPGETGLWLVLGMLVGWGVHKGHNRALRDFGFVHLWQFAQIWPMILACYSGHPRWRPALFICRIMALIFHSRVAVGSLANLWYVIDSYSLMSNLCSTNCYIKFFIKLVYNKRSCGYLLLALYCL